MSSCGSGETTDVVTKEMYDFVDKDGSRIALRRRSPRGSCARSCSTPAAAVEGMVRRHELPPRAGQKGRYRMFDQVGVEVLGVDDADLDVEVIALAARFFDSIGLRQVQLLVNSLGDHEDRARYTAAVHAYLTIVVRS